MEHCIKEVLVRKNRKIHLHSLYQTAAPTFKLHLVLHLYLSVTVDVISILSVWLMDQDGEHLDLRGEKLTIRFHLRERLQYVCTVHSKRV